MQHRQFFRRRLLFSLSFLTLSFCGLACQPKSVLDNPANTAPTPAPPRPAPTQMPLKIESETPAVTSAVPVASATPATMSAATKNAPAVALEQDFELLMLDASKVKLSKLLGRRKVVVINFWATWCGPCRREIPELVALQKDYQRNKEVEILGLSIEDPQQFRELVKSFSAQFEINYKVGFSPAPMFSTFNGTDPRMPIPQTFIFGKDGKLVQHIKGMRPAFKDFIQQTVELALKS